MDLLLIDTNTKVDQAYTSLLAQVLPWTTAKQLKPPLNQNASVEIYVRLGKSVKVSASNDFESEVAANGSSP